MTFAPHLFALFGLRHFDAEVRFGDAPIAARDRKALARDLHRGVASLFTPTVTRENA
jgi:hypothetical protein